MEEVDCQVFVENELGVIIEYRNTYDSLYVSYGYLCRVCGKIGDPQYEQGEIDAGFKPLWKSVDDLLLLMDRHYPSEPYQARFVVMRDRAFLA